MPIFFISTNIDYGALEYQWRMCSVGMLMRNKKHYPIIVSLLGCWKTIVDLILHLHWRINYKKKNIEYPDEYSIRRHL